MDKVSNEWFDEWLEPKELDLENVFIFTERSEARAQLLETIAKVTASHFVDLQIIERMGGFEQSAHLLRNKLPEGKKGRSGDLGEVLGTEFVDKKTAFIVPIRRLRHKDDREMAMRGDDVIGISALSAGATRVLKVEAKSRARFSPSVLDEAREGLGKHDGRPNPSTLAFIEYKLREQNLDEQADLFADLQKKTIPAGNIEHLIFTFSGNDPAKHFQNKRSSVLKGIKLVICGVYVGGHTNLVRELFDACLKLGEPGGNC